jgi:hypothetical protein
MIPVAAEARALRAPRPPPTWLVSACTAVYGRRVLLTRGRECPPLQGVSVIPGVHRYNATREGRPLSLSLGQPIGPHCGALCIPVPACVVEVTHSLVASRKGCLAPRQSTTLRAKPDVDSATRVTRRKPNGLDCGMSTATRESSCSETAVCNAVVSPAP